MRLAAVALLAVAASCATEAGYRRMVMSWHDREFRNLARQWGPPTRVLPDDDGGRMVVYERRGGTVVVPVGRAMVAVQNWCETTFFVSREGIIDDAVWRGNDCEANYP